MNTYYVTRPIVGTATIEVEAESEEEAIEAALDTDITMSHVAEGYTEEFTKCAAAENIALRKRIVELEMDFHKQCELTARTMTRVADAEGEAAMLSIILNRKEEALMQAEKMVDRLAKAVKCAHQEGWWDAAADHLKADVSLARKVYDADWQDSQALAVLKECEKSFE